MPKMSYGETVERRVKYLLEVLLDYVERCQYEDRDLGIKFCVEEDGHQLRFETNVAALTRLTGEELTPDQVRDALSHYLKEHLGILKDERLIKKGSEDWKFSLKLWAKCGDKERNLVKFSEEWHKKRSEPSKKAIAKSEVISPSSPQPVTTSAVIDTQLPPVRKWQGRREELQELKTALGNDHLRLIEITAAGGYGKTALARKFTNQLTADWPVLWVNFNQPYPLAQFGRWLLEELKQTYDEKWNDGELIDAIRKGLTAKPCLLVLNNLETVLTSPANSVYQQFLQKWLATDNRSKLLVTSREQLKFADNLRDGYFSWPLKGLKEADAIRYVTEDHGLTGSDEELAQFVTKMGGHPLLMDLVCSLMKQKFGKGVAVIESQNLGLNLFDVEGYHRDTETCVREVLVASLQRLSKEFRESLMRLSVLRQNFDEGLAQGLIPAITEEDLCYFARLSLLQEFPPEYKVRRRQFQFLPLIKTFMQDQGDAEALRSAHQAALDYFLDNLPSPPWESLEDLTAYLEGFYHAGELGEWQLAHDILNEERGGEGKNKSVDEFLDFQGFNRRRSGLYESLISVWPLEKKQQLDFGKALNNLGTCYYYLGQYEKAIALCQQYQDISEEIGFRQGMAISLGNLGSCYYSLGQYEKAIAHHQQHHDISEEIGFREGVATSLSNMGETLIKLENYSEAETKIQKSLVISQEINFKYGIAESFKALAEIAHQTNQPQLALSHCQAALNLSQELGIPLVKDCEELLAKIQENLGNNS